MRWRKVVKIDNAERLREIDEQIKALKEERRTLTYGNQGQGNTGTQSFNISQGGGSSSANNVTIGKDSITINGKTFQIDPSDMRNLKVVNGRVWLNGKEIGGEV